MVQPPCGPAPAFGGTASICGSTYAPPDMQHCGPPQAYHDGRYIPHPYGYAVSVNQGCYHPYTNGHDGCGGPHNLGFAVMILLQDVAGRKNKPMLPAEIACALPHGILTVGRRISPAETYNCLDGLADTGATCSTYKHSIMMAYCKAYPHHVKEIIDSGDGNFKAVPLARAVDDSEVLPSLSTFLPVIVILFTPWV